MSDAPSRAQLEWRIEELETELEAKDRRIAELETDLLAVSEAVDEWRNDCNKAEADNERLRAALKKYGMHNGPCGFTFCRCGLTEALAAVEDET